MSRSQLRPLAGAAVVGGIAWIVFGVLSVASPSSEGNAKVDLNSTGEYLGFSLFALCLALSVAAIAALHLHQRGADGRLGRIGAIVAGGGAAAQCVVISGIVVNGAETSWFGIAAPLAILTWIVGTIVLAIAVRRAGLMPGWVALLLPVVTVFAIIGSDAGTSVLIGVFQVVVGLRVARAAGASATSPRTARPAPARPA